MASICAKIGVRLLFLFVILVFAYFIHCLINLNTDLDHIPIYDALESKDNGFITSNLISKTLESYHDRNVSNTLDINSQSKGSNLWGKL